MSKIRIKNFGPVKEGYLDKDGWMDIKNVTVFIGNQGSGKSTVAKMISTFAWMEKALLNGTLSGLDVNNFIEKRLSYFRLSGYLTAETELLYEGCYCAFKYIDKRFSFEFKITSDVYVIPKIMYVPAERSFLSSVEDAENVSGLPLPLFTFMDENNRSLKELGSILPIPVGNYSLRYDTLKRISYILGDGYELELAAASSGLHSVVPLYVVSRNLAESISTGQSDNSISALSYTQEQKKKAELREIRINSTVSENQAGSEFQKQEQIIESKYRSSSFLNIVEEPEQNLFPVAQRAILNSLIEFNNANEGNKLIITTHSPYLINYLTLAVKGYLLSLRIEASAKRGELVVKMEKIVPTKSVVNPDDMVIYELDTKGNIIQLATYNGLPSDENYLNSELGETNELFAQLLEIQQQL